MKQNIEDRRADRARLEACARWNERQAELAIRKGDGRDARRFHENTMACRLRQR
jgi:hypothetical protein